MSVIKLQPAGAGLPKIELFFAKLFFSIYCRNKRLARTRLLVSSEMALISSALKKIAAEDWAIPVLIPRIMGIEDSSRNWSVGMTLSHLVITTNGMLDICEALLHGQRFGREIRIQDVKPTESYSQDVFVQLEQASERLISITRASSDFDTEVTHRHPWFGELNARAWVYLAAIHIGIHRRQIDMIRALIPRVKAARV